MMKNMLPNLLGIGVLTAGMVWFFSDVIPVNIPQGVSIHTFVGLVLGLVLVFRTNTAYDRWWEGRRLFGSLTNCSRNFAIKLNAMLPADDLETRQFFAKSIPNFYFALKEHLRDGVVVEELQLDGVGYGGEFSRLQHIPAHIVSQMQKRLSRLLKDRIVRGSQYRALTDDLNVFMDVSGACERILRTPIPISYSIYIKQVIIVYLLTMPLSMISTLHYYTVPMVMFTTYVLAGIELLAEEIEDPFGRDPNDLDTDGMAKGTRTIVNEIFFGGVSGSTADPGFAASQEMQA